jgi:glycosyltransferase involved in cell wall biosynthesis
MTSPRATPATPGGDSACDAGPEASALPDLSLVVPVYDEQGTLPEFHRRVSTVLDRVARAWEILYIDDGSGDDSGAILRALQLADPRVAVITLSRNFGKEVALTAGLDHACGRAVVLIDADLQHPPEVIPQMIERWRAGFDVVYALRTERHGESLVRQTSAGWFYRVLEGLSEVPIPPGAGDFRLLSRRAVLALRQLREHHRFMKGMYAWIGFPQASVTYRQQPRLAGSSKWNYWKLWNFALEGITSFTTLPLRAASYVGLAVAVAALLFAAWVVLKTLLWGEAVAGYPSLMVVILLLGGVQLAALGVIGEYLGRTFNESKRRPLYVIESYVPARGADPDHRFSAPANPSGAESSNAATGPLA